MRVSVRVKVGVRVSNRDMFCLRVKVRVRLSVRVRLFVSGWIG